MKFPIKKQSGAAAIYFVFILIATLGMGALAVEGSRYITEKAHLGDVMEAAAIAVSESDEIRADADFNKNKAAETAAAWIDYLMPDNKGADIKVERDKQEYKKKIHGQLITRTVHEYKISSTTTQDSWMYMKGLPSFEKQQKISNKATAARLRTDFEPVDVVFVSDFSGSMYGQGKIQGLKSAVKNVTNSIFDATQELKKQHPTDKINDSSFAFIPFSWRIVIQRGGDYVCSSMLNKEGNKKTAENIQLTQNYVVSNPHSYSRGRSQYCPTVWGEPRKPLFHNIDRKDLDTAKKLEDFNNEISTMDVKGGTNMYHGLLAAPGQFEGAVNKNRFIIVLSDGLESETRGELFHLVDNGLCKNIRSSLAKNANGEATNFEMFVIGMQFNNQNDPAYRECFGEHIYQVQDMNKLKDVIMELLTHTTSYNIER